MSRPALILVWGEDDHDRSAIKVLVEGLRPDLAGRVTVKKRREPLMLSKGMAAARARSKARKVELAARAEARVQRVVSCVFHKDTDETEVSSAAMAQAVRTAFQGCPGTVVPAVAAWEIEAWWYLFPEAVATVRDAWQEPVRYVGRNTGLIDEPKEKLAREVVAHLPARAATGYREEDSADVARAIVSCGHVRSPRGTSISWEAFVAGVDSIQL